MTNPIANPVPSLSRQLGGAMFAALRFEARRSFTAPRLGAWCLLVLFPMTIVGMFRLNGDAQSTAIWSVLLFILIPEAANLLGLLLWVAPHIQSELDGKTWPYLSVRPYGRQTVYFGKLLNGVLWTIAAGLVSLTLCVFIASPLMAEPLRIWWANARLVVLSGFGYGTLYALLGVIIPKRAILIAVAYTLIFEVLVGMLPAVASEATYQFHLRCLLQIWAGLKLEQEQLRLFFSEASAWQHLAVCAAMALVFLGLGSRIVGLREYSIQDEA